MSSYTHPDALGSLRTLTQGQTLVDTLVYDAFGVSEADTNPQATPLKFVGSKGYQLDADSNFELLGHRYYSTATGRFISQDPIKDGDNWYSYVENDPLDKVDPTGLTLEHGSDAANYGYGGNGGGGPIDDMHTVVSDQSAGSDTEAAGSAAGDKASSGATVQTVAGNGNKLDVQKIKALFDKLDNVTRDLNNTIGETQENKGPRGGKPLPERAPGDAQYNRLSQWGHRMKINKLKAQRSNLAKQIEGVLERAGVAARGLFSGSEFVVPIIILRDPKTGMPVGMYPSGPRA